MATNAKVYADKRRGTFYIQLWWKGARYWRGHYDKRLKTMDGKTASRLAEAINADVDKRGSAFDPRQWFKTPDFEFQFDTFSDKWIERNLLRYAPSVRRQTERYVRMASDFFGEADIREIRRHSIELFLEQGIPGYWASKTKKEVLGLLHKLFHDANDLEMIDRIPGFPKVQVQEPEVRWLTPEWQEKILAEIPERDRPIFQFMCAWGVRPGEARALQWEDVDFEKEIITIRRTFSGAGCNHLQTHTKTNRIRRLPLTDPILPIFKRIRGIGGFVFRNLHGRPYTADLSRLWSKARDKSGAPRVTLYQGTRHSFATQHLDQLFLVSKALGHTTTQMTKRYEGQNVEKLRQLGPPADRRQMDEKLNKIN